MAETRTITIRAETAARLEAFAAERSVDSIDAAIERALDDAAEAAPSATQEWADAAWPAIAQSLDALEAGERGEPTSARAIASRMQSQS